MRKGAIFAPFLFIFLCFCCFPFLSTTSIQTWSNHTQCSCPSIQSPLLVPSCLRDKDAPSCPSTRRCCTPSCPRIVAENADTLVLHSSTLVLTLACHLRSVPPKTECGCSARTRFCCKSSLRLLGWLLVCLFACLLVCLCGYAGV